MLGVPSLGRPSQVPNYPTAAAAVHAMAASMFNQAGAAMAANPLLFQGVMQPLAAGMSPAGAPQGVPFFQNPAFVPYVQTNYIIPGTGFQTSFLPPSSPYVAPQAFLPPGAYVPETVSNPFSAILQSATAIDPNMAMLQHRLQSSSAAVAAVAAAAAATAVTAAVDGGGGNPISAAAQAQVQQPAFQKQQFNMFQVGAQVNKDDVFAGAGAAGARAVVGNNRDEGGVAAAGGGGSGAAPSAAVASTVANLGLLQQPQPFAVCQLALQQQLRQQHQQLQQIHPLHLQQHLHGGTMPARPPSAAPNAVAAAAAVAWPTSTDIAAAAAPMVEPLHAPLPPSPNAAVQDANGNVPVLRARYGLPENTVVFANFNQLYKIDPSTFSMWLRILIRVPNSVLWLLRFPHAGELNLKQIAKRLGVDPNRLVFSNVAGKAEHIRRGALADLCLDTPMCNGHTTGMDILWSGTPMLTLPRDTLASRVASSQVHTLGCPELVASTEAEYEAKAVMYGTNVPALRALQDKVRRARYTSPLFDTRLYARHLEVAFQLAWNHYITSGGKTAHLDVPAELARRRDAASESAAAVAANGASVA